MSEIRTRPRLSGGQKVILAVGGVVALVLVGWGVLLLVNLIGRTSYQRELTLHPTANRLRVDLPGSITIEPGTGPDVRVVQTVKYGLRKPRLTEDTTPDGLVVAAECPVFGSFCSVDAVLTVPASMSVDARSSGGDIAVTGLTGSVQLDSSGGGVTANGLTGSVVARSSGGDVEVTGLTGSVVLDSSGGGVRATGLRCSAAEAHSSGGDVTLEFDDAPDRVSAESSGGGVRIELPGTGGPYRVIADSSGGSASTEVPTDPASSRVVDAHSSGGDVRILTRQAG